MEKSLDDLEKLVLHNLKTTLVSLYPHGNIERDEFVIGNVEGDTGKSLKVNLRTGLWADFAGHGSGRILKLFAYRHNNDFAKGLEEVFQLLKLPPPLKSNKYKPVKKEWLDEIGGDPIRYLSKERKIPRSIISACKVKCTEDEYVFLGYDEQKKLAYAQYTSRNKDGSKNIRFSPKQYKPVLWGMHSMPELNTGKSVIITEGVIDAMTFRSCDMFAVSIHSGINDTKWIENSWNWLAQFEIIHLAFDWDEAGQDTIREIAGRLGLYKCKKTILPEKDANEVLLKHPTDWIQLLKKALDDSKDFFPPLRTTAREARQRVDAYIEAGPIAEQGQLLFGWHFTPSPDKKHPINFRFRPGEQTVYTGYTGAGKTSVLFQHLAYAMFIEGDTVALASLEEPVEKVITVIIKIALGEFPKVGSKAYNTAYEIIADRLIIYNVLGIAELEDVLEFFEYASKKDGAKHCALDSLMQTDIDIDGDKATVNAASKKIIESITRVGAHYHIVAHSTKGDDENWKEIPKIASVKGIQEITARAHNVIICWRNKVKEASIEASYSKNQPEEARRKEIEQPDSIIKIAKNRNGKFLGQIKCWFNWKSDRFRPQHELSSDRPYLIIENEI